MKYINKLLIGSLSNKVRLMDSDNGLDLFCYTKCESSDPEELKRCRGIIFNGDTLVMNVFRFTYEYTEDDHDIIEKSIGKNFKDCLVP